MGATAPRTVGLAIRGPITRADLAGLCDRVCTLLGAAPGSVVLCDVHGVEPDGVTVDALCRLQLGARRHRCQVRLRNTSRELLELVEFMGLTDVLTGPPIRSVTPESRSPWPRLQRQYARTNMTRFVVDCGVVLQLASEGIEVPAEHELLAPTLLRSQTLSALHEAVHRGEIPPDVALDRLTRIWAMPIRLLGDAVLRRRAWNLAEELGWAETYDAEYVALTLLQADAFVTLNAELARRLEGIVATATIEALRTA